MAGENKQATSVSHDGHFPLDAPVILFRENVIRVVTAFQVIDISRVDDGLFQYIRKPDPLPKKALKAAKGR